MACEMTANFPMPPASSDDEREHRITYEVVVDCYDDYEVTMGWYYYLEDKLAFPFAAKWLTGKTSTNDIVQVQGMASEEECKTDMLVEIEYSDGELKDVFTVPLADIQPVENEHERMQAFGDWQYWLEQGNELIDPDEYEEY